ncbi:MAG: hypothetical protein Q8O48_12630 [Anaerolineales bacterium]|nr:hypothetical protein [Anaerolineales bacterium]
MTKMKATISVDHRVSDGADIVPFRVSRPARSAQTLPKKRRDDVSEAAYTFDVFGRRAHTPSAQRNGHFEEKT